MKLRDVDAIRYVMPLREADRSPRSGIEVSAPRRAAGFSMPPHPERICALTRRDRPFAIRIRLRP